MKGGHPNTKKINKIAVWNYTHFTVIHQIEYYKNEFHVDGGNMTKEQRGLRLQADFCHLNCYDQKPVFDNGTCLRSFAQARKIEQVVDIEYRCSKCPVKQTRFRNILNGSEVLAESIDETFFFNKGAMVISPKNSLISRNGKYAFGHYFNTRFIFDIDEMIYVYKDLIDKDSIERAKHYNFFYINYDDDMCNFVRIIRNVELRTNQLKLSLPPQELSDSILHPTNRFNIAKRRAIWDKKTKDYAKQNNEDPKAYDQLVFIQDTGIITDIRMANYDTRYEWPDDPKFSLKRFISSGEFIEGDHFSLTSYNDKFIFRFDDAGRRSILESNSFCNQDTKYLMGSRLVMTSAGTMGIYSYKGNELCKKETNSPGARIILKDDGKLAIYSEDNKSLLEIGKGSNK